MGTVKRIYALGAKVLDGSATADEALEWLVLTGGGDSTGNAVGIVRQRLEEVVAELEELRAVVQRVARQTKDGVWVTPGDQVWITRGDRPRWYRLGPNFRIPVCVMRGDVWEDIGVEDCFSSPEAASRDGRE